MKYPPREGDLPRDELAKRAQEEIDKSPCPVDVYFKFTCEHCGERVAFRESGKLYEFGECDVCHKSTEVKVGGFALHYHVGFDRNKKN